MSVHEVRALTLLEGHLNPEQLASFRRNGCFNVSVRRGWRSDRTWRLGYGRMLRLVTGYAWCPRLIGPGGRLCVDTADHWLPEGDRLLALKLALETNERHVIRTGHAY